MKPFQRPSIRDVMMAGGVAACCAIVAAVTLSSLSSPKDLDARAAAVEQKAAQAKRLFRPDRQAQTTAPDAVCSRRPEDQAAALRQSVGALATQAGLEMRTLDVRPEAPEAADAKLVPVRLRFEAIGPYDAVVGLVGQLSQQRPEIFVDAVDLVSKTSTVTIAFSGRVFCSA